MSEYVKAVMLGIYTRMYYIYICNVGDATLALLKTTWHVCRVPRSRRGVSPKLTELFPCLRLPSSLATLFSTPPSTGTYIHVSQGRRENSLFWPSIACLSLARLTASCTCILQMHCCCLMKGPGALVAPVLVCNWSCIVSACYRVLCVRLVHPCYILVLRSFAAIITLPACLFDDVYRFDTWEISSTRQTLEIPGTTSFWLHLGSI